MNTTISALHISKTNKPEKGLLFGEAKPFSPRYTKDHYQMIDFWDKFSKECPEPYLRAWLITSDDGEHIWYPKAVPVILIDKPTLEELGVWVFLPENVQKMIIEQDAMDAKVESESAGAVIERMQKARAARRSKYAHIPKQMTCTKCKNVIDVIQSQVQAKMDKHVISLETFQKEFVCRTCNPFKPGRQPKPELAGIPNELTCKKCGNKVPTPRSNIAARAKLKGVDVKVFMKDFECQTCHPTKGRQKGSGTKSQGNSIQKLVCVKCKAEHSGITSQLEKRVKKLGITLEQFLKQYKCQTCCPTKGRKKKKKGKVVA